MRQLYATPPPEFVAARNELVKRLRREKRRDEATALAGLRRPAWEDWSLNAVAASDGDVVDAFAAAAADVRDAQAAAIEGRDGPDIRTALRDLRDRSADLVRRAEAALAGAGRQAATGELNGRLSQIATNDVAVEQLRAGILGSGDTSPRDLFGDVPAPAPARPRKQIAPSTTRAAAKRSSPDVAAERRERAEQQRLEEALAAANRQHATAVKARRRAESEVAKAEAAVERARDALAGAEEALAAKQSELTEAVSDEDEAAAAVERARAAID